MTTYLGNASSNYLGSYNWDYNWNKFYMWQGNDTVYAPETITNLIFYGDTGNDYFVGSRGQDTAYGGSENDTLYGLANTDFLYGEAGNDKLYGGSGNDMIYGGDNADELHGGSENDYLYGGAGTDHLYGGSGQDYFYGGTAGGYDFFHITKGESNAVTGQFDWIYDWNSYYDTIDSSIVGRPDNYAERSTTATTMATARSQVQQDNNLNYKDHVFLYNPKTDVGYLLSDLDQNYSFETGVRIQGAGTATDMSWADIL